MGFAREPKTLEPLSPIRPDLLGRAEPDARAFRVECVDTQAARALEQAWSDLADRAAEPNVFLTPAFAIPLLQHIRFKARPKFLLVWDDSPRAKRLVGLLPIHDETLSWFDRRSIRGFHHKQVALGTPLVDRDVPGETIEAMLDWLGDRPSRPVSLTLGLVPIDGAFGIALREVCARRNRSLVVLDAHERAILIPRAASEPLAPSLSPKRRKELGRQRRRMEGFGALTYRRASTPTDIRRAAEQFLALECEGWKGRRGTAMLSDPTLATFTRTMTRLMAHEGRCRIDSLEVDGAPVAMGILVMAGNRAHFWKTTFSERFSMYSPGVQFALALTQVQAGDDSVSFTDSCAVPDHPMIDRLWPDRIAVADIMIALRPRVRAGRPEPSGPAFAWAVRLEMVRRRLRHDAKNRVNALRKRLRRSD